MLTGEHLHFFMFLPKCDLRVPLDAITEITFTKSHFGIPMIVGGQSDSYIHQVRIRDPDIGSRQFRIKDCLAQKIKLNNGMRTEGSVVRTWSVHLLTARLE